MDEQRVYSSRIVNTYLEYLHKNYPGIDAEAILEHAGIARYELEDEGHWLSQRQINLFHEKMDLLTGNPHCAREAGRYQFSSGSLSILRQYIFGFLTPSTAFSVLPKITSTINRGHSFETKILGAERIEIIVRQLAHVQERKFQCENRTGALEALTRIFIGTYPRIDHDVCLHKGGDCCKYVLSWEKTPLTFWKRLKRFVFLFLPFTFIGYLFAPAVGWTLLIGLYFVLAMAVSHYSELLEKKQLMRRMEEQSDSASLLLEQINKGYNNSLLVQEIGQAISSIRDIDLLLAHVMETLEKRLDFDRGVLMLGSADKSRLLYKVGYGYSGEHQEYLEQLEFNIEKPGLQAPLAVSFREQKPILVDDLKDFEQTLSERTREFVKLMKSESFICVPIVFKGESLGVLMVDNIHSKRNLNQSDISLLIGVANQIAISMNNAVSYQKILESEQRFRSLSENAPDMIFSLSEKEIINYVNPAWERLLGHSKDEVLGRSFLDFVREENAEPYVATFGSGSVSN